MLQSSSKQSSNLITKQSGDIQRFDPMIKPNFTMQSQIRINKDLKIAVYGKRLTSKTASVIKSKSWTVKCSIRTIYYKNLMSRVVTKALIGGGCIFIYSCSARRIYFEINCNDNWFQKKFVGKNENIWISTHPSPINALVTALLMSCTKTPWNTPETLIRGLNRLTSWRLQLTVLSMCTRLIVKCKRQAAQAKR